MATWNSAFLLNPKSTDTPTQGDDEIRTTRSAIQERIKNEHTTYDADATGGVAALDWLHKAGSAVGYYLATASAPAVGLSGSPLTAGQLWYDTTLEAFKVWTGAAWITIAYKTLADSPTLLKTKVVDVGDWNMDATASVAVAHGLTSTKIRAYKAIIRNDADTITYPLEYYMSTSIGGVPVTCPSGRIEAGAANMTLTRFATGTFDSVNFDATSYNRGWITIWYVP